jgi:large subunit ribosomal protein L1
MATTSKRYRQSTEVADLQKTYPLKDAVDVLYKFPTAKFDETIELSIHLGVDPRQSDQMVRGTVQLPHGSGKSVRVLVFTDKPEEALKLGADYAGLADMIAKIQGGWADFDVAISTTEAMKEVRSVARVLGPRGLMPNPKSGTVSDDIASAIREVKAGRVEFKMDKTANVGVVAGKRSFSSEQVADNVSALLESIGKSRPKDFKGRFILSATISSTMSPGVALDKALYSNF